jgi:hypothetical protein
VFYIFGKPCDDRVITHKVPEFVFGNDGAAETDGSIK